MNKTAGVIVIAAIILFMAIMILVFHGISIKADVGLGDNKPKKNATIWDGLTGLFNILAGYKK